MDSTLVDFVKVLRTSSVRVSPAETLDAMRALDLVGCEDREFLKNTLSIVLCKDPEEKEVFDSCFDRFFTFDDLFTRERPPESEASQAEAGPTDEPDSSTEKSDANGGPGSGSGGGAGEEEAGGQNEDYEPLTLTAESPLGSMLMRGDRSEITLAITQAGRAVKVNEIVVFTQKGLYTRKVMDQMGLQALTEEIASLDEAGGGQQLQLAQKLKKLRDQLRERVRDYVEQQFLLHADESGRALREELLKKVKLSNVEKRNFKDVQLVVLRMAKKLVSLHSKRRKTFKRGQLDLRKTLRRNMRHDGNLFDIRWKSQKVDRPRVMAICDVSGSVSDYSRFLLMFLYSLTEVLPKVRAFAFSSDLGEVTRLFETVDLEDAISKTLRDYGGGSTDYGTMLEDLRRKCLKDIDRKTTVIILGDARNNYGNPRSEILREVYEKSQRLIWLNPEPRSSWNQGDAEMRKYLPACHQAEVCNSLIHLERVAGNLLRNAG